MSYLSERNSQLEEEAASVPQLTEELQSLKKRVELLLVLLGEKEEELEAALQDMQEVKTMYRSHMEELIEGKLVSDESKHTILSAPPQDSASSVGEDSFITETVNVRLSQSPSPKSVRSRTQ